MSDEVKRFGKVGRDGESALRVECTIEGCDFSYGLEYEEGERPASLDALFGEEGAASRIFGMLMQHGLDAHGIGAGEVLS